MIPNDLTSFLYLPPLTKQTPSLRSSIHDQQCLNSIGDSNCYYAGHNEGVGAKPCCTNGNGGSPDLTCNYIGGDSKDPTNFVCQSPTKDSLIDVEEEQLCYDSAGDSNCYYAHFNKDGKPCCDKLTCNHIGGSSKDPTNFVCEINGKASLVKST